MGDFLDCPRKDIELYSSGLFSDLLGMPYDQIRCYELTREVYHRLGIELPDYSNVTGISLIKELIIKKKKLTIELDHPEPFCIVLIAKGEVATHLGVVLDDCKCFIHSCGTGVTISKLRHWKERIRGYYKWKQE